MSANTSNNSIVPDQPSDILTVAEYIHRRLDQLTRAERKAARLLLSDYPIVGLDPLAEFARRADVSHPTILRFIAKLGFSGYPQFQTALREELKARLKSPLAKHWDHDSAPKTDNQDFFGRFAEAACENIRRSAAALPRGEFEGALSLLTDTTNTAYVLGGRFTDSIATYLYMHLRVLRARLHHVTGPPVSWSEYLLDMDRNSVLLVFDIRRYQDEVVHFAREAAQRGASVVLITDQWLSPVASVARHILATRIEVPSSWDSVSAMVVLVEALIAGVNNGKWDHLQGRIQELEELRAHFGRYGSST